MSEAAGIKKGNTITLEASPAPTPKKAALNNEDINMLLRDSSTEGKIAVLEKIAGLYTIQNTELGLDKNESVIVEDIFRGLMRTAETKVRAAFSESIKKSDSLPKDIALFIAKDIDEVALPVLQFSPIFDDGDLLDIVQSGGGEKLRAIAKRDSVSEPLSQALVTKDSAVIETLLTNNGAKIGETAYNHAIGEQGMEDSMVKAMIEKGAIPFNVMETMMRSIKGPLRQELAQKYHMVFENKDLKKQTEQNLLDTIKHTMSTRGNKE